MAANEIILVVLITLGFSIAVIFAKTSLNKMDAKGFVKFYFLGAAIVIFIEFLTLHSMGLANITFSFNAWAILLSAAFGAAAAFAGFIGMKRIHAGVSGTIFNLQGPLIALFGVLFYRIYPSNMVFMGILISVIGLIIMGLDRGLKATVRFTSPFLLLSVSPLLWALEWILFSFTSSAAPVFLTFLLYLFIFIILWGLNYVFRPLSEGPSRTRFLAIAGGSFAGVANGSYGIFITYYGPALTGIVTLMSVPVSVLLAFLILKERYNGPEFLGMVLVCIGLVVSTIL